MAIKKKYLKSKPVCKVSFQLDENLAKEAQTVELLGSFSDWEPISMRKVKGGYTRTLDLETGAQHEFKYRVNGENWLTESEADGEVMNVYSTANSVVRV